MPIHNIRLQAPLLDSFRVHQVAGLFDVPLDEKLQHSLTAELPGFDEDWTIGAIVGPSGSGKTTLARAAYGDALYEPKEWSADAAIIDGLGNASLKTIARVLTAVGLGSVPTWLKPYRVLSTGERFRADLARAVLEAGDWGLEAGEFRPALQYRPSITPSSPKPLAPSPSLLVIDEFTSTLDRTVANTMSAALSRLLRNPQSEIPNPKLIVLTCHRDILPWLQPDWTLDLGRFRLPDGTLHGAATSLGDARSRSASETYSLTRGRLRRPTLRLAVRRVPQKLWTRFARHHYLAGGLAASATCYAAFWDNKALTSGQGEASHDADHYSRLPAPDYPRSPTPTTGRGFEDTPVAFCAVVAALGWKRSKRITRLVTLPEFQGLGIASRLAEAVATHESAKGNRVTITASHPAILAHCSRSRSWKYLGVKKTGSTRQQIGQRAIRCSAGRAVASFEFVPQSP